MSIILLVVFLIVFIGVVYVRYLDKRFKTNYRRKNKKDLDRWMSMTREDRQKYDYEDKQAHLEKRRSLLKRIRKKYIDLSNSKNN